MVEQLIVEKLSGTLQYIDTLFKKEKKKYIYKGFNAIPGVLIAALFYLLIPKVLYPLYKLIPYENMLFNFAFRI